MQIKEHFLQLVAQKGGFKPLHAHFDKSNVVTPELLIEAQTASMQDKWLLYRNLKSAYTFDDVYKRSEDALHALLKQNVSVVRTFADADSQVGQMCVDALCKLKEDYSDTIHIEIAIQPLEGITTPASYEAFVTACSKADLVGGLPSRDPDPKEHLVKLFEIACKYDLPVDVHVDQLNSPQEKETELLALVKTEVGFSNKVNAVHSISLSAHPKDYQQHVARLLKETDIGVIICPSAALSMKPMPGLAPIHNSIAPLQLLVDNDVDVALGIDNIADLFMPLVDADMWFECRLLMEATRCYDLDLISTIATRYI